MLIAHLPAGYLLARALRVKDRAMIALLAGAVAPDADVLWWAVFGVGSYRSSWTHVPAIWLLVAIFLVPLGMRAKPDLRGPVLLFLVGIALHLLLDNLSDGIRWLWPWSDRLVTFVYIPAVDAHWLISVLTHWTYLTEAILTALASWLFLSARKT